VLPAGAVLQVAPSVERVLEEGAQVRRTGAEVLSWYGQLVAGHGFARRTEEEEGWPIQGFIGAESAGRIGGLPQSGPHGEQGVWGLGAPRITKPPAHVVALSTDSPQGPWPPQAGKARKRA
jgi:hypothetical protein